MTLSLFLSVSATSWPNFCCVSLCDFYTLCGIGVVKRCGYVSIARYISIIASGAVLSASDYPRYYLCIISYSSSPTSFIPSTTSYFILSFSLEGNDGLPAATLPWTERKAGTESWGWTLKCAKRIAGGQ